MDNVDKIDDGTVTEELRDGAESPGEAKARLVGEVQVHAAPDQERASPDYMDTRDGKEDGDHGGSSSSSSSDDEEAKEEEAEVKVVEVKVEEVKVVEVEVKVEEQAAAGSRRSSASSASSASSSLGDPCDDPPVQPRVDTTPDTDHILETLEVVTLDETSAAPAEPSQPEISLFVKVGNCIR